MYTDSCRGKGLFKQCFTIALRSDGLICYLCLTITSAQVSSRRWSDLFAAEGAWLYTAGDTSFQPLGIKAIMRMHPGFIDCFCHFLCSVNKYN